MSGELLLRDLQLVLWPSEALAKALPKRWTMVESGERRELRRDGALRIEIVHRGDARWLGHTELHDLRAGYRLSIDSALR